MRGHGLPLVLMAMLAACSGSADPGAEELGETSAALSRDQMMIEALIIETALLDDSAHRSAMTTHGNWWIPRPLFQLLDRWGVPISRDCVRNSRWVDGDGDGLPADGTATLACVSNVQGSRVSATGAVRVVDQDDAAPHSGYAIELFDLKVTIASPNVLANRTTMLEGKANIGLAGARAGRFDRELTLTVVEQYGTFTVKNVVMMLADVRYTPDAAVARSDPWAAGMFEMHGGWTVQTNDYNTHFGVWTDRPLHYDRSCALARPEDPGFDGGSMIAVGTTTFRLDFVGCGLWRTTYRGEAPPAVP
jgi:hypothetical protein